MKEIKITCLGGIGEIGMNLYVYETDSTAIVVDYGIMFADTDTCGINTIAPKSTYLDTISKKLQAVIFTHGHDDHIGGVKYAVKYNVPIYASEFTSELINYKIHKDKKKVKVITAVEGINYSAGDINFNFYKVPHSIPGSYAVLLNMAGFQAIHMADFKTDNLKIKLPTPESITGGLDLLLLDATNAKRTTPCHTEEDVKKELDDIFKTTKGKIVLTTFSSNIDRLATAIEIGKKYGRKVVIEGASMARSASIALKLGLLHFNDGELITAKVAVNLEDNEVLYLVAGCQGEMQSSLYSIATGVRKTIQLKEGDTLIFSCRVIPGNDLKVAYLVNSALKLGANVIEASDRLVHISGHANAIEQKYVISALQPRYLIPIHGEYRHLIAQREIGVIAGLDEEQVKLIDVGEQAIFNGNGKFVEVRDVPYGKIYLDHRGNFTLNESEYLIRRQIARDGVIVARIIPEEIYDIIKRDIDLNVDISSGTAAAKGVEISSLKVIEGSLENQLVDSKHVPDAYVDAALLNGGGLIIESYGFDISREDIHKIGKILKVESLRPAEEDDDENVLETYDVLIKRVIKRFFRKNMNRYPHIVVK